MLSYALSAEYETDVFVVALKILKILRERNVDFELEFFVR